MSDLIERVEAARQFPTNTCGASRHAEQIGVALVLGEPYPMLTEEPNYCGESILATVAALWEARTEIERLTAALHAQPGPVSMDDVEWAGKVHLAEAIRERDDLRCFVGRVLGEARQYMSDIDGGDVQAWAVECGLLEEWTASEPCGEQCECAEVASFPTRCFRLTETGKAAVAAVKEQR